MASKKKRLSVPFSASSSSTDTVDKETLILGEMSPPDNVSSSSTEVTHMTRMAYLTPFGPVCQYF